jgi:hypothetical protein
MILDDIPWHMERSRHVQSDQACLSRVCDGLDPANLSTITPTTAP